MEVAAAGPAGLAQGLTAAREKALLGEYGEAADRLRAVLELAARCVPGAPPRPPPSSSSSSSVPRAGPWGRAGRSGGAWEATPGPTGLPSPHHPGVEALQRPRRAAAGRPAPERRGGGDPLDLRTSPRRGPRRRRGPVRWPAGCRRPAGGQRPKTAPSRAGRGG